MTEPASDDDDDPVMRSMRSVWLSMREEDPPQGGLAELMAAARAKAEVMAPPKESWWQRVFATLRRPPVLAMATVVLLVGGAVIIGKRQADVTVERMAPAGPTITYSANDETRDRLEEPEAPAAAATIDPHGGLAGSGTTELAKDQGTVTAPRPHKKPPRDPIVKPPVTERPKLDVTSGQSKSAGTGPMIATDSDPGETAPMPPPTGSAPTMPQPEPPDVSRPATIAQLVEQSAAAAARGDCATVKTTSARIRKLSPAVYNDQIAKNAAIAKCLK